VKLIIGLDGANPDLKLPEGTRWESESFGDPPHTGPNWLSIYTGVSPEVHGVTDGGWLLEHKGYSSLPVTGIFDVLENWVSLWMPMTSEVPEKPGCGCLRGFPTTRGGWGIYRCSLPVDSVGLNGAKWHLKRSDPEWQESLFQLEKAHLEWAVTHYGALSQIDTLFYGSTILDRAGHGSKVLDCEFYHRAERFAESLVDRLLDHFQPDDWLVCSDHGFEDAPGCPRHSKVGLCAMKGRQQVLSKMSIIGTNQALCDMLGIETGKPIERTPEEPENIKSQLESLGYL